MIDLAIFESPGGKRLLSLTPTAQEVAIRCNEHGYESLSATVPRRLVDALALYQTPSLLHVVARDRTGFVVFEGRLEDPSIYAEDAGSGIRLTAYGYQNAYRDVPYTALWSTQDVSQWRPVAVGEYGGAIFGERFDLDQQGRLMQAPKKGLAYDYGFGGGHVYELPSSSARDLTRIAFAWQIVQAAGATWQGRLSWHDASGAAIGTMTYWGGPGPTSGTQTITAPAGATAVMIILFFNSGTTTTFTGEDNTTRQIISDLRVTTATTPIDGGAIARALVDAVAAVNPSQVATNKAFIQSPGYDLTDEVYEDQYPADILDKLVALGDNQVPPRLWQWAVWEDRVLRLAPRGSGRTWYVNAATLQINRTYSQLANSAYTTYQDASGRTVRTAVSTDAASVAVHGITRRQAVSASTTNSAQALVTRNAVLLDGKRLVPQVQVAFGALYHEYGGRVPVHYLRPDDTIVVRNLRPLRGETSGVTSFRVLATEYQDGGMTATPESPVPTLETLLARREERI